MMKRTLLRKTSSAPLIRLASICALSVSIAACSSSTSKSTDASSPSTTIPRTAPTEPTLVIDDNTGFPVGPGAPSTTLGPNETTTTVLVVSTLAPGPTSTVPNKGGPNLTLASPESMATVVAFAAKDIYRAATIRDYARLEGIIGDRKFRWGFVGQRKPAAQWQLDYHEGREDQILRIIQLLETPPGIDANGNTVWPGIAVKDPTEWTIEDDAVAASLGFQPENIMETKIKGRYVDYRLTINAEGIWTGMFLGG